MMDAKERADLRARMREAWEDHDDTGRVIITMKEARVLVEDVLAPTEEKDNG